MCNDIVWFIQDTKRTAPALNPSANERDKDNHFVKQFLDNKNIRPAESSEVNVGESEREASETLLLLSSNSHHSAPKSGARYLPYNTITNIVQFEQF